MISRSMKFPATALAAPLLAGALLLMSSPGCAQRAPGAFMHFPGAWSGGGTITLSNGSKERIRCRANYAVDNSGAELKLDLRCASDSYRFELQSTVTNRGGEVSGNWSESGRGAGGTVSGTASGSRIDIRATGPTFTALMSMNTTAGRQTISIESPGSELSAVAITLSKG